MMGFLDWLFGPTGNAAIAGAFGGLVRWLTLRSGMIDGAVSVVVGSVCAVYLGPLALPIVEAVLGKIIVEDASRGAFSGFIIGLGGVGVATFAMDIIKSRTSQNAANKQHKSGEGDAGQG